MSNLQVPGGYKPLLNEKETEHAIVLIKEFFQLSLSTELSLTRVTAPLFVQSGLGINDDLNGVERPVRFPVKDMGEQQLEIVHSLAKWKRLKIAEMGLPRGFGIYTPSARTRTWTTCTRSTWTSGTGKSASTSGTGR